ncbi:3'-5' exonuclease [Lampropedia puyangensis]|uniref:3'-5' exonuclease n=1 Tax=Lampropedia puyangensis TaxID=1330072 RepID=A0A4S8EXP5_9BURK|nr:3'-5' exonuclease [Lampropedia puyangensis]THT99669.1 3'-5' exonuclease [Lampropedia puyangensis]
MWARFQQWFKPQAGLARAANQAQPALAQAQQHRIDERMQAWLSRMQTATLVSEDESRLSTQTVVVVDVESTGLNHEKDAILSIGGVRIVRQGIDLGCSFERVMNVQIPLTGVSQLFHGLTQQDLAAGDDPRLVLMDLLEWGQGAVWLAWHAWFDQALLHKALTLWFDAPRLKTEDWAKRLPVYDLAHAMPALFPQYQSAGADLDAWLQRLGLTHSQRHNAVADAMATAELALIAMHQAQRQGIETWTQWHAMAAKYQKAKVPIGL